MVIFNGIKTILLGLGLGVVAGGRALVAGGLAGLVDCGRRCGVELWLEALGEFSRIGEFVGLFVEDGVMFGAAVDTFGLFTGVDPEGF